jgi:hypothetical protein
LGIKITARAEQKFRLQAVPEDDTIFLFMGVFIFGCISMPSQCSSTGAVFVLSNYAFHILPQFWQTHLEMCFVFSFCFFGAKIFASNANQKKQSHLTKIHHHPIQHHQIQP